jgi:hypothetical protein
MVWDSIRVSIPWSIWMTWSGLLSRSQSPTTTGDLPDLAEMRAIFPDIIRPAVLPSG